MKPETKFKINKVYPALEALEDCYFEKIQQVGLRGTPDIIGCYKGFHFALELKVDSPTDPLQIYKISRYDKAMGFARVVTPVTLKQVIEDLKAWPQLSSAERHKLQK